jgi:hypothetical protein
MALGLTQPLKKISIRNIPGSKGRPVRKADNLTAICEPTVQNRWVPQRLTTLWASMAYYRDTFNYGSNYMILHVQYRIFFKINDRYILCHLFIFFLYLTKLMQLDFSFMQCESLYWHNMN